MFHIEYLQQLLVIAITLSTITCTLVQKTKSFFSNSKIIIIYSLIINLVIGVIFCITFTDITLPTSLWIGLFGFIGADSIYKSLEGKILSYTDILNRKNITISKENIINEEDK
ncbi:MAG: hypothetical protein IJ097_05065 [Bacilli bacterium]|nr:hypothetical protein [Bacilli bacterium]